METEEKPKEEINSESVLDELRKYLENATQEQLDKDWEELKQYNEVGPEIVETFSCQNECYDIHQPEELQDILEALEERIDDLEEENGDLKDKISDLELLTTNLIVINEVANDLQTRGYSIMGRNVYSKRIDKTIITVSVHPTQVDFVEMMVIDELVPAVSVKSKMTAKQYNDALYTKVDMIGELERTTIDEHNKAKVKKCEQLIFLHIQDIQDAQELKEFLDNISTNSKRLYVSAIQAVYIEDLCEFIVCPTTEQMTGPYLIGTYKDLEIYINPDLSCFDENCYVEK